MCEGRDMKKETERLKQEHMSVNDMTADKKSDMTANDSLYKQLNRPIAPEKLKNKIYSNWEEQLSSVENKNVYRSYLSIAASFLLMLVSWLLVDTTPTIVYAAINDIADETKHANEFSVDLENIVDDFKISLPLDSMQVKMTKHCMLDEHKTVHLQLAGISSGEMHVFLKKGEMTASLWQMAMGDSKLMPWRLIHPRQDLSVLIFFDGAMGEKEVKKITQRMFYI